MTFLILLMVKCNYLLIHDYPNHWLSVPNTHRSLSQPSKLLFIKLGHLLGSIENYLDELKAT